MLQASAGELVHERDVGAGSNKVVLNVGGLRHETYVSTLRNIPDTRLYSLTNNNPTQLPEFDPNSGEFFFDRHPLVFAQILNYYRTGKLHCPSDVCGPLFEEELAFWGLEDAGIETCCWMNYKKHGEAQANLSSFDKIVDEVISEPDYGFPYDYETGQQARNFRQMWKKYQSKIWVTLEEPSSSLKAKIIAMTTMVLIIASVMVTCLETVEYFSLETTLQNRVIRVIEIICVIWFTIEFIIRATVCPSKRNFAKKIMNWLDLAAIMPFYIELFLPSSKDANTLVTLRVIRLIRVFRVFKLCRHSYSLQILGHTLKSSLSELFLLGFFLSIGIVVFSSLMYFAESDSRKTQFTSIPAGFWWAIITMTTVGYGDFVPSTWQGRLVGTCCAVCGVLTVALPIPVIVSNFSLYYSHAKARQKSLKKKRPLVIGAANALKLIEPFVGPRPVHQLGNSRPWPAASFGTSFEESEPSPRLSRRVSYATGATAIRSRWSGGASPELGQTVINIKEDITQEEQESGEEEVRTDGDQEDQCVEGARDNEGITRDVVVHEETQLPKIEIQRASSISQKSCSNDDSEHSDHGKKRRHVKRKRSKSRKARGSVDSNASNTIHATQFQNKTPAGRMGRRDSVFVVGFIGKKWMAKAARSRSSRAQDEMNHHDFLSVSPSVRSMTSSTSPYDALSVAGTEITEMSMRSAMSPCSLNFTQPLSNHHLHTEPERKFDRRSSCPHLQGNILERNSSFLIPPKPPLKPWKSSQSYATTTMGYVNPTALEMHEDREMEYLHGLKYGIPAPTLQKVRTNSCPANAALSTARNEKVRGDVLIHSEKSSQYSTERTPRWSESGQNPHKDSVQACDSSFSLCFNDVPCSKTFSNISCGEPVQQQTQPVHQLTDPVHQQVKLLNQQAEPVHQQVEPAHQQAEPVYQQAEPVHQQAEPVHQQAEPAHQQAEPAHQQAEPAHQQAEPVHQQAEPINRQTEPVNQHTLPVHQLNQSVHQQTESVNTPDQPVHQQIQSGNTPDQPVDQQSQPVHQQSQSVDQQSQPVVQQSQPVVQQSQPVHQQSQSVHSPDQPVRQQSQPVHTPDQPVLQPGQQSSSTSNTTTSMDPLLKTEHSEANFDPSSSDSGQQSLLQSSDQKGSEFVEGKERTKPYRQSFNDISLIHEASKDRRSSLCRQQALEGNDVINDGGHDSSCTSLAIHEEQFGEKSKKLDEERRSDQPRQNTPGHDCDPGTILTPNEQSASDNDLGTDKHRRSSNSRPNESTNPNTPTSIETNANSSLSNQNVSPLFNNDQSQSELDSSYPLSQKTHAPQNRNLHEVPPEYKREPLTRYGFSSKARRNTLDSQSRGELPRSAIPKVDSGVYSVDRMSSVDSLQDQGIMMNTIDTINKAENRDMNAECILRLPFLDQCEKKTSSFIMTIKDETVV